MAKKASTLSAAEQAELAFLPETVYITADDIRTGVANPTEDAFLCVYREMDEVDDERIVAVYKLVRTGRIQQKTTTSLLKL